MYSSVSLALAALEYLVNVDPETAPAGLVAVAAEIPEGIPIMAVSAGDLPKNWRSYPPPEELPVRGTKWAESLESAVLRVPSAIVPQESNLVLNPRHPDFAKILLEAPVPFRFDTRVWKKRPR